MCTDVKTKLTNWSYISYRADSTSSYIILWSQNGRWTRMQYGWCWVPSWRRYFQLLWPEEFRSRFPIRIRLDDLVYYALVFSILSSFALTLLAIHRLLQVFATLWFIIRDAPTMHSCPFPHITHWSASMGAMIISSYHHTTAWHIHYMCATLDTCLPTERPRDSVNTFLLGLCWTWFFPFSTRKTAHFILKGSVFSTEMPLFLASWGAK